MLLLVAAAASRRRRDGLQSPTAGCKTNNAQWDGRKIVGRRLRHVSPPLRGVLPHMPQKRDPKTNPKALLGKRLRLGRIATGFSSQDALAAHLGFDRTVIAKAETGDRPPTSDVLAAWCEACGLDADLFADLTELAVRATVPYRRGLRTTCKPNEKRSPCLSGHRS
jgi:Helix-turn-helix domain